MMVKKRWICAALLVLNLVCFGYVTTCDFINYDDPMYVTNNAQTLSGLSWSNVQWAFSERAARVCGFWIPLTWVSLQLDTTLFGPAGAWGFHLTNLLFHLANAVLLFLVLHQMTGDLWPSAIAAALYSIHPLRVESVAWVTERKDVMCGFFLLLALAAYHRYTQKPGIGIYAVVFLMFLCALMAKPMAVTFPFALLLLDYWPLGRLRLGQTLPEEQASQSPVAWWRLFVEKIPLFALTALMSFSTMRISGSIGAVANITLSDRVIVPLSGYLGYVEKTLWPINLAAIYPILDVPIERIVIAVIVLAGITALAVWQARARPALLVGWLWFLGTTFPVSGVAQSGPQAFADRFMYIPHIGVVLLVVWGLREPWWSRLSPTMRRTVLALVLVSLGTLTWLQVLYWRNSGTLFAHALSVVEKNYQAHLCMCSFQLQQGEQDEALTHAERAVEIAPDVALARLRLGTVLVMRDDHTTAAEHLRECVRLDSSSSDAYYMLGLACFGMGHWREAKENLETSLERAGAVQGRQYGERTTSQAMPLELLGEIALHDGRPGLAVDHLTQSLQIRPNLPTAHHWLGVARARLGDWASAEASLREAVALRPGNDSYRGYLAWAYARQNKSDLARAEYAALLADHPAWLPRANELAMRFITRAPFVDPRRAEELATQIGEATNFEDARSLNTLAAVQAAAGQFDTAIATANKALERTTEPSLRQELQERVAMYQRKQTLPIQPAPVK